MSILSLAFYAVIAIGLYTAYRQFRAMFASDVKTSFTETLVVTLICAFWPLGFIVFALITVPALLTIMIWSAYKRFKTEE